MLTGTQKPSRPCHVFLVLLLLGSAGCGPSQKGAAPSNTPSPANKTAAQGADTNAAEAATKSVKSEFVFDPKKSRDPFYPNAKYAAATPGGQTNQVERGDLVSQLVYTTPIIFGTERTAIVSGVALEVNKTAIIPVTFMGKEERLRVRCLRIERDYVELKVEGVPQTVRLKKRG